MIFIGYYTPGPYADEAAKLVDSLDALGLEHDLTPIEAGGTWQQITSRKPRIIRDAMERHPGVPLVYVDVDALVLKRPELLWTLDCDVAAAIFGGKERLGNGELLSGTVYFAPTETAVQVVDRWIALQDQYPEKLPNGLLAWDQRTLAMAIMETGARFVVLPHAYTYMDELSENRYPGIDPVIRHTRGSLRHNPEHK